MACSDEGKRIVFTTWGSFGDIHPFMALALEMQARGHRVAIATLPLYREKIEAAGIGFYPTRPDTPAPESEEGKEMIRRAMDERNGPRYVMGELLATNIRETYSDTLAAVTADGGADLMVSHAVPMAAPLVAATTGIEWISTVLSPISLMSAYDPPTPPQLAALRRILTLHPSIARAFINLIKKTTRSWVKPVSDFRRDLGLPAGQNPMFDGQHSPTRVLALFSKVLARIQPDHPPQTVITGFPFYDRNDQAAPSRELLRFLDDGEPPIVFTLGSTAVRVGENFFRTSIEVARRLKRRALLLVSDSGDLSMNDPANGIGVFDYAPHSLVMPRASVVVHQGGIGTAGQALRAGRPMLIVPHGQDQPDNARRCVELGVGRLLAVKRYSVGRVTKEIGELLANKSYGDRAAEMGRTVEAEHGSETACNLIEDALRQRANQTAAAVA
jgi:rhamnosyltransferase subunit B